MAVDKANIGRRSVSRKPTYIGYVDFCQKVVGVILTPGQRIIGKVCYDGINPEDLPEAEKELARKLFGDLKTIPAKAKHVVTIVVGRGGGKSFTLAALRLLHLAMTVSLDKLPAGQRAIALIVAPDLDTAQNTLRYAVGAAEETPAIASLIVAKTARTIRFRRPEGKEVSIETRAASRKGAAVRGRSFVGAVLEEAAFFRDEEYRINDAEIFHAISPRILPGGQIILVSTPWSDEGLLYEFWKKNFNNPETCIVAHAPTLLLRDDEETQLAVERGYILDPEKAQRELGAEFQLGDSTSWFDRTSVENAIDNDRAAALPPDREYVTAAGADFGFVRDSSGLIIVQAKDGIFYVADIVEKRPTKDTPLKPSEVVEEFALVLKNYKLGSVLSDVHYREAIREYLEKWDIHLQKIPEGLDGKVEMYSRAKTLFREGRVKIPNHPKLINQLKSVTGKRTSGGKTQIELPRKTGDKGGHGDLVSAFVAALWHAYKLHLGEEPALVPYSDEWFMEQARKNLDETELHFMYETGKSEDDKRWRNMGIGISPESFNAVDYERIRKR